MTAKFKVGDLVDLGRGYLTSHRSVEIQDIAVRDRLDDVLAYLTARAEWLRREPP